MSNHTHLMTWVRRETKERFGALARTQGVSESALLRRIVEASLGAPISVTAGPEPVESLPVSGRVSVRLRNEDLLLLRERAKARGLPAATYLSFLVRSHLRRLVPLPDPELKALKLAIGEISAIGRNLNQIARAANIGESRVDLNTSDLRALLQACVGLRDAMKAVVSRNLESWEAGYEKKDS